jgi:hypothetical protein
MTQRVGIIQDLTSAKKGQLTGYARQLALFFKVLIYRNLTVREGEVQDVIPVTPGIG